MSVILRVIPTICLVFCLLWPINLSAGNLIISEQDRERWQALGRVNIGGFKSRGVCTGTLIAPDRVLTAAHCVVDPKTGVAFPLYRVHFVAAWHKGAYRGAAKARAIHIHPDYPDTPRHRSKKISFTDIASDLAVIELDTSLDEVTPAIVSQDAAPLGPVVILGYRHDRQEVLSEHLGCDVVSVSGSVMQFDCPVVSGTSGAPVLRQQSDETWRVIGVISARNAGGGVAPQVTVSDLTSFTQ